MSRWRSTNQIEVEVRGWSRGQIELTVEGEGREELTEDRDNRFVRGLEAAMGAARGELPEGVGWRIAMRNGIPLARGLGSSAAATVAGIVGRERASRRAAGHGDAAPDRGRHRGPPGQRGRGPARRLRRLAPRRPTASRPSAIDTTRDLRAVLFIPERRLPTEAMRKALPATIPLEDAVANLGAVALGVAGLATGRTDMLARLTVDRLHEPYRAKVYPELPRMVAAAREAGALGACLSGAGSTIIAFADSMSQISRVEAAFVAVAADSDLDGQVVVVEPRNAGAKVIQTGR